MKTTQIKLPKKIYTPYPNWTVEYDNGMKSFDPSKLSLHLEPEQKDGYINGEILAERLKETALTSNILQHLIENPSLCPEEWKKDKDGKTIYVYFWGTILRHPSGYRCVLGLFWIDGRWVWRYDWLDVDWGVGGPGAVLASSTSSSNLSSKQHLDTLNLGLVSRVKALEDWKERFTKSLGTIL